MNRQSEAYDAVSAARTARSQKRRLAGSVLATSVALGIATAACSLLTDTDDLAGPPQEPSSDGGDAHLERSRTEASPVDGATADASYCAKSTATFCDDFDREPLGETWTTSLSVGGGALTLSAAQAVSPPNSLSATSFTDGGGAALVLLKRFPGAALGAQCAFDLRVEAQAANGGTELVLLSILSSAPEFKDYSLDLIMLDGGASLTESVVRADGGRLETQHPLGASIPKKTWSRIVFDVALPPNGRGTAALTIGGAIALTTSLSSPPDNSDQEVGIGILDATGGSAVHYDNVTCTIRR